MNGDEFEQWLEVIPQDVIPQDNPAPAPGSGLLLLCALLVVLFLRLRYR